MAPLLEVIQKSQSRKATLKERALLSQISYLEREDITARKQKQRCPCINALMKNRQLIKR